MYKRLIGFSLIAIVLATITIAPAVSDQKGTANAASAWVGKGRIFKTGEDEAMFVGAFIGVLYVETTDKKLDSMKLVCPGSVDINLKSGAQKGSGDCILTDVGGDRVYAEWICEGADFLGCSGKFTLTGGVGKFEGITGESELTARTAFQELTVELESGKVWETSAGLLSLPEITYNIP